MSHEIEANYIEDYYNDEKQCQHCNSFELREGACVCTEYDEEVRATAHCDFFQSVD